MRNLLRGQRKLVTGSGRFLRTSRPQPEVLALSWNGGFRELRVASSNHNVRNETEEMPMAHTDVTPSLKDSEIAAAIARELDRQNDQIELIASENIVSTDVLKAQGSILTNKYAD